MNEMPGVTIPFKHLVGMVLAGLLMWFGIYRFVRWISPW